MDPSKLGRNTLAGLRPAIVLTGQLKPVPKRITTTKLLLLLLLIPLVRSCRSSLFRRLVGSAKPITSRTTHYAASPRWGAWGAPPPRILVAPQIYARKKGTPPSEERGVGRGAEPPSPPEAQPKPTSHTDRPRPTQHRNVPGGTGSTGQAYAKRNKISPPKTEISEPARIFSLSEANLMSAE